MPLSKDLILVNEWTQHSLAIVKFIYIIEMWP